LRDENLYIVDSGNRRIRKINLLNNIVNTLAGDNTIAQPLKIEEPSGIAVDLSENVYYCELSLNVIRKINRFGIISHVAGTGRRGSTDGPPNEASFNQPRHMTVDRIGNIYVVDSGNNLIRKIEWNTYIVSTVVRFPKLDYLSTLHGIALDSNGIAYITDINGNLWYC